MISRRRLHLVLTLLMPLLLLRALLPAGYMVAAAEDGPRMVLCSAGLAGLGAPAGDSPHELPAAADDCAFAHAAVYAPAPQRMPGSLAPALELRFLSQSSDDLPPSTGPPRGFRARAPPALFL